MSTHYLAEAGLYRATLEQMLYGAPTQETEAQGFNDSVLERKDKKVNELVQRFERNLKLEDSSMEVRKSEVVSEMKIETKENTPSHKVQPKVRKELSMERFVQGILMTSSPIPQNETMEIKVEAHFPTDQLMEIQETPILRHHPTKLGIDFNILDTGVELVKPNPLQPQTEVTKTYRSCLKSEGRVKVAEAKSSSTPRPRVTFKQDSPDSAYNSPGTSCSSAASTPPGPSPCADTQTATTTQAQEDQPDIYLKLSRALLHDKIKKYASWKPETIRPIAVTAASIRLSALQKISSPCEVTQVMQQMYERCTAGEVTKEMDTIVVAIFHLLDVDVHAETLSVPEEYIVRKYCKKAMQ